MVKFNLSLSEVSELKIGKRTFKVVRDLSKATERDFLLYVGLPISFLNTGNIYSIREVCSNGDILIIDEDGDNYTIEEGEDGFVLLKPEYTEREKEFIRFGRQPEQFKIGDVVQLDDGVIGVITNIYDEDKDDKPVYYVNTGVGFEWGNSIRLIAPVEHTNQVK